MDLWGPFPIELDGGRAEHLAAERFPERTRRRTRRSVPQPPPAGLVRGEPGVSGRRGRLLGGGGAGRGVLEGEAGVRAVQDGEEGRGGGVLRAG